MSRAAVTLHLHLRQRQRQTPRPPSNLCSASPPLPTLSAFPPLHHLFSRRTGCAQGQPLETGQDTYPCERQCFLAWMRRRLGAVHFALGPSRTHDGSWHPMLFWLLLWLPFPSLIRPEVVQDRLGCLSTLPLTYICAKGAWGYYAFCQSHPHHISPCGPYKSRRSTSRADPSIRVLSSTSAPSTLSTTHFRFRQDVPAVPAS